MTYSNFGSICIKKISQVINHINKTYISSHTHEDTNYQLEEMSLRERREEAASCRLLMGLFVSIATMEDSVEVSQNTKTELAFYSAVPFLGTYSMEMKLVS